MWRAGHRLRTGNRHAAVATAATHTAVDSLAEPTTRASCAARAADTTADATRAAAD